MPYDDDDDLFADEFDFVDDDDDSEAPKESSDLDDAKEAPKSRGRGGAKDKAEKPAAERPKGRSRPTPTRRNTRPPAEAAPAPDAAPADFGEVEAPDDAAAVEPDPAAPAGPPSDHVVHIYEFGRLKRTIPRKFTDEEAVSFAEEYTRTGKAYGRYAVATPEDEEPAPTFAGASRGG